MCAVGLVLVVAPLAGQSRPLGPLVVVRLAGTDAATASAELPPVTPGTPAGQLAPLPVTRLELAGGAATLDSARPPLLRFTQPLPIRDVLLLLVRDTGLSLIANSEVDGTFTGELSGVTLRQAFDLVLHPQGFDYTTEGNAIRVFRRRPETRIFDLNIASAQRRGSGPVSFSSSLAVDSASGSRANVEWTADGDAFADVAQGIRTLLSADGRFSVDRKAGVVQVTDDVERLDRVAIYIESVERRLRRQVEIQARVIEVTLTDPASAAVNWEAAIESARSTTPSGAVVLDFSAFMTALAQQGTVAILASPRITALHNEPALMRVGIQDVTFERQGGSERATAMLDGFSLAVVPSISADGVVIMNVSPSVSQRTGEVRSREKQRIPVLAVDEISTAVRLRDGETLVLPGLRREREQSVAATGRGLGSLFKREETRKTSSEVAVLLTPKVI